MDTDLRATSIPQSNQTSTDSDSVVRGTGSQGRVKAPTLHVQTGVRAGGFYDQFYGAWFGATEDYNQADQAAGHI